MKQQIERINMRYVVCPWCGFEEPGMEEGKYNCYECGKSYRVYRDVAVTYSTFKEEEKHEM